MANFILAGETLAVITQGSVDFLGSDICIDHFEDSTIPDCEKPIPRYLIEAFGEDTAIDLVLATCVAESEGIAPADVDAQEISARWTNELGVALPKFSKWVNYRFACVEALGGAPTSWRELLPMRDAPIPTYEITDEQRVKVKSEMGMALYDFKVQINGLIKNLKDNDIPDDIVSGFQNALVEVNGWIVKMHDELNYGSTMPKPLYPKMLYKNLSEAYKKNYGIELDEELSILFEVVD